MGTEVPFAGRLRLGARLQYRWDAVGEPGVDRAMMHEGSLVLTGSWAPTDRLVLSAEMPLLVRDVSWPNLSHALVAGPGDADLRARMIVLRDRAYAPENVLAITAGVKLPTSIDQVGPDGTRLPFEAQTGTGTIDPLVGLFYSHFEDPWAFFASAHVALPFAGRFEEEPGPSLRATVAGQVRLDTHVSLRAGVDARFDAPASVRGRRDPETDAFALFVSPDFVWSPMSDLLIAIGLRIPVLQLSEQPRDEGWYVVTSIVGDV